MEIVKTIRRMKALIDGLSRCPEWEDGYFEISDAMHQKFEDLRRSLRDYRRASEIHRKQVDLACRYLGVNPHTFLMGSVR